MTDESVRTEIMTATYEALCAEGYSSITAQTIADRTDKSKSLLFYHYDSLDDLIEDFLTFLLERIDDELAAYQDTAPTERLVRLIDWYCHGPTDEEQTSFHTAMLELRAQAPHNPRFRAVLGQIDDRLRDGFEEPLRQGIESGQFQPHDPEQTAALLIAAIDGARIRQLTLDRGEYLIAVKNGVYSEILEPLLVDGGSFPRDRTTSPVADENDTAGSEDTRSDGPTTNSNGARDDATTNSNGARDEVTTNSDRSRGEVTTNSDRSRGDTTADGDRPRNEEK